MLQINAHTMDENMFKVDQHSVLNKLNHDDSAIKRQIYILGVKNGEKKNCSRIRFSWAKILLFLSNKTFQVFIFENIHIAKSYIIKFLVNIWNYGKNLEDLSSQNPC